MRIAREGRFAQPDRLQDFDDADAARRAAEARLVNFEWLADNRPDAHPRIERSERILKHHLHFPAKGAQGGAARGKKIASFDEQFAGIGFDQAQQNARQRGLAAAGFADNRERFSGREFEAYIVNGSDAGVCRRRECAR